MKIPISILLALFLFTFAGGNVFAQYKKITVILMRHAEKDVSEEADTADPELSEAGKIRALKLAEIALKYKPEIIYSTDYIRTKATVAPLASKLRAMTFIYDPKNLDEMYDKIMSGKYKRIVVVGHNDTTPELANLLMKEEKYERLGENEYDKIFVVKIKKNKDKPNKVKEKVKTY